jgi:nucleotide-binding universal stress UspA family protein
MKTLLIPIDFSDTSANTLKYAVEFSKDAAVERIILLNTYYVSLYEQLLPSADFVQLSADGMQEERRKIEERVKSIGHKLAKKCDPSVQIETVVSELTLLRAIHQLVEEEQPYMLMIGSDNHLDESYIGEQVIAIAKTSAIPVFIVPVSAKYQQIKLALVPCDFAAVSLDLLKRLHSLYQRLHPELMILNIDPSQDRFEKEAENSEALKEILQSYTYKVYYPEDRDTVSGMLDFAKERKAQLIIALPGSHSFFYNLTHRSIIDALALNSN